MIRIDAISLSLHSDEDSYCFSFDAKITRPQDFNLFSPGQFVKVVFYGIEYHVIIDKRSRTMEFGKKEYSISGRGKTAILGQGWSNSITRTWGNTTTRDIVEELCAEKGITVIYNVLNWNIPVDGFSVSNEYRIDVIKKIAEACGGIIQTASDGKLVISPKYKVSPVDYDSFVPDIIYEKHNDIVFLSENFTISPKYNKVVVTNMDEESTFYSIEIIEDIDSSGECVVAVYTFPFKDTLTLHTSSTHLSISYLGKEEKTEEELVEIITGKGSVKNPIKEVISSDYIGTNLGVISTNNKSITTASKDQSLIFLTYKTEYHKFRITTSDVSKPFQIFTTEE